MQIVFHRVTRIKIVLCHTDNWISLLYFTFLIIIILQYQKSIKYYACLTRLNSELWMQLAIMLINYLLFVTTKRRKVSRITVKFLWFEIINWKFARLISHIILFTGIKSFGEVSVRYGCSERNIQSIVLNLQ